MTLIAYRYQSHWQSGYRYLHFVPHRCGITYKGSTNHVFVVVSGALIMNRKYPENYPKYGPRTAGHRNEVRNTGTGTLPAQVDTLQVGRAIPR